MNMLPPVIVTQPASQTVDEGMTATFTIEAIGSLLSYQWKRDGSAIDGATDPSYTTGEVTIDDNEAVFNCVVSNAVESVTSTDAVLTVTIAVAPVITEHPLSQTVDEGATATFTIVATGSFLNYQWQRNGTAIEGANEDTYSTDAVTMGDDGASFTCVVNNTAGSVTSNAAILTVTMLPPVIETQPTSQTVDEGSPATFTIVATGSSLSYQWQRGSDDIEGATESSYTLESAAMADNGATFLCIVGNASGSVTSDAATLTVTMLPPVIETQPASQTVDEGLPAIFTVVAAGTNIGYQWYRDGTAIDEATEASYTVDAATMDYNGAEFTCVVSNVGGSVTSDAAVLTVNMLPPEIATHPADQTVDEGSTAIFTVVATGTSLSYQWRRGGSDISGATAASYTTDATTMGDDGASFTCVVSNEGGSVTSDAAILTVNMLPPSIVTHPTDQTVDEGSAATFTVVATGTDIGYQWQREAEDIEGATAALYTIDATTMDDDDASFRCVVSNAAGSVVSDAAILTVNMLPPVITTHPASQSVVEGSTSTFTVVATGTALSYQWQRDGSDITGGANDASYTTPVTILSDNGATFRCVVSNEGGTVTSNEAVLTVTMLPPVIETHPVSQTVDEGATATFTVTATGDELAYQWQKNGFNPMWKDGIKIGNLPYQKIWEEISGMTESRKPENLGHLWCHSDKSIDTLLAISIDDASHKGEWYLSGINAADNEDITSGVVDGIGYIYLGDIGDNSSSRSTITIRRVTEPTITGGNGTIPPESIESIICEYPADNVPSRKDAECLMFDSRTNKLFIITKRINPPKVYSLQHQSSYSGIQTLSFEGNAWDGMVSAVPFNNMNGGYVTGGTISKDGTKILLRGYRNVYFFSRDTSAQTVIQALQATPVTVSAFVDGGRPSSHWDNEPHGEGICFDPNDVDFYTSSESGDTLITGCSADNYPLRKYYNIKVAAVEDTFRQGYASYAGCEDTYIHSDEVSDVHDEDVFIVDKNYNSAGTSITNERLGLLKFDLSALPPDAVVIGADLRLNISQEGQDFAVHACYVPWDEASTWNSVNDGNGIPFDDVAASSFRVSVHGAPYSTANNHGYNNITGTVTCKSDSMVMLIQDWINGTIANNGFVIENIHSLAESKGDGFQFGSSEAATESLRPILIVRYYLPTSEPPYSDVPGATEATYTTPPAVFEDSGSLYRCVVSNPGGAVPSNGATLAVNMLPPVIVTHPASQTVDERSSAAFTIAATGVSLRYQWQRNGSDIPGATGAAYTTAATTMDDDGVIFRCVVRNTAGTVPSGEAELTVNRLPPEIKVQPVDRTVTEGETATFSIDILGSDVSYQWRRGDSDIAGATGSSYTTDELTISDDGAIFTCVVTNSAGAVTSDPVTLTVTMLPPTITTQPALQKVDEGSTATFTIMAIGTDLGYQWQRGGSDISGATEPSYTTDPATMADDGAEFLCIVSNVGGTVTSEAAILTVTMLPPEITTQPYSRTIDEGAAVTFTVAATGTALNYQWRRDGSDIAGGTDASYTIDAATMTDNGAEFLCVVSNDGGSVTSGPAVLTVTMLPPVISTQPVSQTVDEGSAVTFTIAATGTDISYQWRRDGSDIAGGTDASYTIDAATMADDGAEFRCVVSNAAGTETSDAADLTVTMLPPVITTQPASQTVTEGATATFTVAASGTDLGYQWRRDGGDIPGATSASFTTAAATMVDAGAIFTCKVSNAAGSVTSNEAVLTVTMLPPEITTQPASQAVDESSTVTFAVVATGTSLGYQWRRDGGDITGATGASYTIDQVTMADDGATFRCVVSNVGGSNTTDAAVLTVNKLLEIVFAPGWNMISFNIHPLDSFIETVFASIEDLVLVKNNAGQVYWPEFDINTIGSITTGEGYKVYTLSADTIRTPGRVIEVASTPISLTAGWSMIAYLPQNEMSIETALNGLESEITLVKDNEGNVYWPEYSINTIGMMKPGQGYKIHMKSAVTLIFP
ncbi:MAG: immunoglobulin domain-containing protein [Chitinispirillaceae bacterium]|nr:immunoglobulin domain-containing protein [Chitinispirillaceae bacterium]